ncbi:MAG: GAF domain-containing sensor histidine kinase [Dehalococcoidales bacterium]|nr:GAF domain-containing sensor histidine kinase [Dehalococcoidales bacterium]
MKTPGKIKKPGAVKNDFGTLSHDLSERVKELNCLYGISRLFENGDRTLGDAMQSVVDLIPPAWQYPEDTCARIKLKKSEFKTANFKETRWKQSHDILVNGERFGTLEVYYLVAKPASDEGPFLEEERNLLRIIAARLGMIIERENAKSNMELMYVRERELRKKLQSEIKMRADLTRKLIHELKTPLTALIATSQLLSDETRDEKTGRLAKHIFNGANNMNRRIEELHDVTRGEMGQLKLTLKRFNIEKLLNSILEETRPLAEQFEMKIDLEIIRPLLEMTADPDRVRQIIMNLVNNAIKYAREGKKITIKAREKAGEIIIEVRDYGPGIPQERTGTLFEPGYQVAYQEASTGGLGIGLSLCKVLVELHGGKIWARSTPGKGSGFVFSIPLLKPARNQE